MTRRRVSLAAMLAALAGALMLAPVANAATEKPAWKLHLSSQPTNFAQGGEQSEYVLYATNVGSAPTSGPITLTEALPEHLTPISASSSACTIAPPIVTCVFPDTVWPGEVIGVDVGVSVDPLLAQGSPLVNKAKIEGGGASPAEASTTTIVTSILPDFDFLAGAEGLSASLTDVEGEPQTQAGSHPNQFTVDVVFPSRKGNTAQVGEPPIIGVDGGVRDLTTYLPRGLVGNPAATPMQCTEAQLEGVGCPEGSQVGNVDGLTVPLVNVTPVQSPLYNMVPPPGAPAAFGFDAIGVGIFIHIIAGIRPGDYAVFASSNDVLSRFANPVLGARVQLWGDPSAASHDHSRGECATELKPPEAACPVDPQSTAFLTLPTACSDSLVMQAEADSWGHPDAVASAEVPFTDLKGDPVGVKDCDKLQFEPSIKVHPTTNLTDSPTGLDVELSQPQDFSLSGTSTANLKDATIVFPPGLAVNASQANGLEACSADQIGLQSGVGGTPVRFSGDPAACPEGSKVGTVEATSPLLAQYNGESEVQRDSQGNPIPEVLHGSLYIAKPFENPFNSLIATYLTIEDPRYGIVIKLAGKVEPDLATGQLRTRFAENPQLPVQDVRVHLFSGSRAPLQTPPTCTTYTTSANLTSWSAPRGPDVAATDSFHPTATPLGGPCPSTEAQLPNVPSLAAATLSPQAGTYSPLIFKLSRADGTQRLAKIETTLPPGLSARLAGVGQCSEAQLAKAQAREQPNLGALEQADPSCPGSSEVGVANVGAGAGPTPFYVQGHAYLAGPYKGAPLSLAIITPAVAGPFDLGAVVVRSAVEIDPTTAQARAVSDPLPTILQGIPIDVRSVALKMARPNFTINPTSCDPLAFSAAATSTLGQVAGLSSPFQAGGCKALPYKPKNHTRLFGPIHRGGHPRLRAVFEAKPGEANSARISFALPHSEFIDQAHFRTICTRVQFAADQCPAGSTYGHVKATSPLLDYPLEGPIYLRSSTHQLPDTVLALHGPPRQPIEVDLVGRVDSVNGGLRTIFEAIPDAPVTKAIVTLQGGKKGLFQNSTNICKGTHRATLKLNGQNAKTYDSKPALKADCGKSPKKKPKG